MYLLLVTLVIIICKLTFKIMFHSLYNFGVPLSHPRICAIFEYYLNIISTKKVFEKTFFSDINLVIMRGYSPVKYRDKLGPHRKGRSRKKPKYWQKLRILSKTKLVRLFQLRICSPFAVFMIQYYEIFKFH